MTYKSRNRAEWTAEPPCALRKIPFHHQNYESDAKKMHFRQRQIIFLVCR